MSLAYLTFSTFNSTNLIPFFYSISSHYIYIFRCSFLDMWLGQTFRYFNPDLMSPHHSKIIFSSSKYFFILGCYFSCLELARGSCPSNSPYQLAGALSDIVVQLFSILDMHLLKNYQFVSGLSILCDYAFAQYFKCMILVICQYQGFTQDHL